MCHALIEMIGVRLDDNLSADRVDKRFRTIAWLRLQSQGTFTVLVQLDEFVWPGKVVVTVNDDVRQTLNGKFQVRSSSLKSCLEFFIGNVVATLARAHSNALNRLLGTIDMDEDENHCVPKSSAGSELAYFLTDWI